MALKGLPETGMQTMRAVKAFYIEHNRFSGTLPKGIQTLSLVVSFLIGNNTLKGALPESGLRVMQTVRRFRAAKNKFKGALPESGIRTLSFLSFFDLSENTFRGALPQGTIQTMQEVQFLRININSFRGALPESGLQSMKALIGFEIWLNGFKGAFPGSNTSAVTSFHISRNGFEGALSDGSLEAMQKVRSFDITRNSFKGTLPGSGLRTMRTVRDFDIFENSFEGALPESGLRTMSAIKRFGIYGNLLGGTLPESGLQALTALRSFDIFRNSFKGTLPSGIRKMSAAWKFDISTNGFAGALPGLGLLGMRALIMGLRVHWNRLTGTLPEVGIRTMARVQVFSTQGNDLTGFFPESGLEGMRSVRVFYAHRNRFAGALPEDGFQALTRVQVMAIDNNYLEGGVPSFLDAQLVFLGSNLLAGSIPQRLLRGTVARQKCVVADAMLHEGTVPTSASRMTMEEIILSFGHGLGGVLPSIPGTISLLSLWENGLEGHMHELHLMENSTLLVYNNDFSCKLPHHCDVRSDSTSSLALMGNHFAQPRHVPAWIMPAEQPTGMFCVSNHQSKRFIALLCCGGCCFLMAVVQAKKSTNLPMDGRLQRARFAWYETCQKQKRMLLASCVLLPVYNSMLVHACAMVADHWRLHVAGKRRPDEAYLVAFFHLCSYQSAAHFHDRLATHNPLRMRARYRRHGLTVYSTWILVCVTLSVPGILYSVVKAVPGFLRVSDRWQWVIGNVVALFTGLLTGFGLEFLAGKVSGPSVDSTALQVLGMLLASALLPGLMTTLCHADCLGAWTSFWPPSRGAWPFSGTFGAVWREVQGSYVLSQDEWRPWDEVLQCDRVSKREFCRMRWHMNGRDCMEAALEHLVWLLYPKLVHQALVMPAIRIMRVKTGGKGMTLQGSLVLLKFVWLLVTWFGPCLPILNILITLLVTNYTILLFGSYGRMLEVKEKESHGATLPSIGFTTVTLLALVLQWSNLL